MEKLNEYFAIQKEIFEYFGYVEDWRVIPLDDSTEAFWYLTDSESSGCVRFAESVEQLEDEEAGNFYENEIYTQRHLPKWIYRGEDYTMIYVDTHTDGNTFLQIFSNDKERSLLQMSG
jgi:hypothetical protein